MNILVIDIGGTHVKVLVTGETVPRKADSGPTLTAIEMVSKVKELTADWSYDVLSIGYPGPIHDERPIAEPHNLGEGWLGFDFAGAFGKPVKMLNDAAMQALGSYRGGRLLFLGLGTGLGTALVLDGKIHPMEMGHLVYKKGRTYEDYIGLRGMKRLGKKKWRKAVQDVTTRLRAALEVDDVVLGGGNAKYLKEVPEGARLGDNENAFLGGFAIWKDA
ncbi:MAG TPA: ROK family protein [Polyangiaceae bacterium]|jgi:polyphosphate glucokinase|nr:ROK family protein [Polyangiaceae bacterium]